MRTSKSFCVALLAAACVSEHGPRTNRMAQSATPYLAQRPSSRRPAALVQRLAMGRSAPGPGALKAAGVEREGEAVRGAVGATVRALESVASVHYAQSADLMLTAFARTRDSAYLR